MVSFFEAIENPFSARNSGLTRVHASDLNVRGDRDSQKRGFDTKNFSVLVFDNGQRMGYILCFNTKRHWESFKGKHLKLFDDDDDDSIIDWKTLQNDGDIDTVIPLKDAHVDGSRLPKEKQALFHRSEHRKCGIFIHRTDGAVSAVPSSLSHQMIGKCLSVEEGDYREWIKEIKKMAKVEEAAMEFRSNLQTESDGDGNKVIAMRSLCIIALSVFISAIGTLYAQYLNHSEKESEINGLNEMETLRQNNYELGEGDVVGSPWMNKSVLLRCGFILSVLCFVRMSWRCCSKSSDTTKWRRDLSDGRLSSIS